MVWAFWLDFFTNLDYYYNNGFIGKGGAKAEMLTGL